MRRNSTGLLNLALLMMSALVMTTSARAIEPPPTEFEQPDRIVVISDILGEYGLMMELLRNTSIIGPDNQWDAGDTHLVILGNVAGVGRGVLPAFEQIKELEGQAEAAGGKVHMLLGFSEIQLLHRDLAMIDSRVYEGMTSAESERKLKRFVEAGVQEVLSRFPDAPFPERLEAEWRSLADRLYQLGAIEFMEQFAPGTELGDWLRSRNVIIRIGDYIFSHGGLSPEFAEKSLQQINDEEREKLATETLLLQKDIDIRHPSWWKGLVTNTEIEMQRPVDEILANLEARAMVVGVNLPNIPAREGLGARVFFANSGIAARQLEAHSARLSALEITPDAIFLIWDEQRVKATMPGDPPQRKN